MQFVHGPDFPTAGTIIGTEGIREAYATGRGRVIVRARGAHRGDARQTVFRIIVFRTAVPGQQSGLAGNAWRKLVRDKKLEGISELRDESDRSGMRVVIELRPGRLPATGTQSPLPAHRDAVVVLLQTCSRW